MDIGVEVFAMALKFQRANSGSSVDLNEFHKDYILTSPSNTDWDLLRPSDNPINATIYNSTLFYRHSTVMTAVYCIAYFIVFLVGLIGNSFVIAVVFRAPRMRTVTNYFIANLALADFLVIVFCLPATLLSNIFVPWILGWWMCKTVPYIQGVSVAASVYSLIAVSLDRFLAIWWPLKLQITKRRARIMIICIWIIAIINNIPCALFFDLIKIVPDLPEIKICAEVWPPGTNGNLYFLIAHLVFCYVLPFVVISLCYILIWIKVWTRSIPGDSKDAQMDRMQQKSKFKVVKMLVAVVILFVLSWLPLYLIFARIKLGGPLDNDEEELLQIATPIAQWLGSSNSCINPILYAFFNKKYRKGFAAIIRSRKCCGRLRYYDTVAIASSSTSTRKSSRYHNHNSMKKPPYSPSIKSEPVSYIYEQNNNNTNNLNKRNHHNGLIKQESTVSCQGFISSNNNDINNVNNNNINNNNSCNNQNNHIVNNNNNNNNDNINNNNNGNHHNNDLNRQNSNNSRQMLLIKQDSNSSRDLLAKIENHNNNITNNNMNIITRKAASLQSQDSTETTNTDLSSISRQDTEISYIEAIGAYPSSASSAGATNTQNGVRKGILSKQDTQISYIESKKSSFSSQDSVLSLIEHKRHKLVKQDSIFSYSEPKSVSEQRGRNNFVKQDSVISFADQKRGLLSKQDSLVTSTTSNGNKYGDGHYISSILKKTDSQSSSASPVRKSIGFFDG